MAVWTAQYSEFLRTDMSGWSIFTRCQVRTGTVTVGDPRKVRFLGSLESPRGSM